MVRAPAPVLAPFFGPYVGYHEEGGPPAVHRGLPSGTLTLVIPLVDRLHLGSLPDGRSGLRSYGSVLGGLHAGAVEIHHDGRQMGVQLEATPLGARALFGFPAAAIAHEVLELDDVLGGDAPELLGRLHEARGWQARFDVLDDVFGRRVRNSPTAWSGEVAWTGQRLVGTAGRARVSELAEEVGWSRRHLGQRFRAEVGLSPKTVARIVRFEQTVELLRQPHRPSLAVAAALGGYADQAHLTREFGALAGCAPTTWLA